MIMPVQRDQSSRRHEAERLVGDQQGAGRADRRAVRDEHQPSREKLCNWIISRRQHNDRH